MKLRLPKHTSRLAQRVLEHKAKGVSSVIQIKAPKPLQKTLTKLTLTDLSYHRGSKQLSLSKASIQS